jgi:hypothetical protein
MGVFVFVIDKIPLSVHRGDMAKFVQKFIDASRGKKSGGGGASSVGATSGLTETAKQEQASASDRLKRQRNAFRTTFAGETGNVSIQKSDKLGITGGI